MGWGLRNWFPAQGEEMSTDRELLRSQKIVDHREPDIIRTKLLELGWHQERLYTADYYFWTVNYKKVGIERKSVSDLLGSLNTRFSEQLYKMTEHFDFNILLIEGSWKHILGSVLSQRGIEYYQWSMVWNFLRTWQDKGLTLELTSSEGHTIRRLNELYAYYMKDSHAGGITRKVAGDPRLLALQCGGVGPKLGTALLEKFGSLRNIALANVDDFAAVDKIGHKKAQAIFDHFNKGGNNAGLFTTDNSLGE